jgi:uncharacterized protein YukE
MEFFKEGIMARIRVNTEDLKEKAKDFDSAAEAFNRAGDDILAAAMAMPSYDGQLSGPARKAGYEIQTQCRDLTAALSSNAESLRKSAQAFEEVDNRAIDVFFLQTTNLASQKFFSQLGSSTPIASGGNHVLGYEDYGDYVILWKNGVSIIIYKTDQNLSMLTQFQKDVDDFCEYCEKIFNIMYEMLMQGLAILPVLVLYLSAQCGAIVNYLGKKFPEFKEIISFTEKMLGLIGIKMDDILEKFGIEVYSFDPFEFGDLTKDVCQYSDLANAAYKDAERIWDYLEASTP